MTRLFGGDASRQCEDAPDRPECLMLRFREVVVPGVAEYALPFRVFEEEKRTPLYYLVPMTNHDLGMREMKKAMVKEHGDMTFWPVTVRDPKQVELDVAEQKPYRSLQAHLSESYAGRTLSFVELLNEDYANGVWPERAYRAALNGMAKEEQRRVEVRRNRLTESGKPAARAIKLEDALVFPDGPSRTSRGRSGSESGYAGAPLQGECRGEDNLPWTARRR